MGESEPDRLSSRNYTWSSFRHSSLVDVYHGFETVALIWGSSRLSVVCRCDVKGMSRTALERSIPKSEDISIKDPKEEIQE